MFVVTEPKPFIDVSIITRFNKHSTVMQFKLVFTRLLWVVVKFRLIQSCRNAHCSCFLVIQILHGLDSRDGPEDWSGFPGSLVGSVHPCDWYPGWQTEGKARHHGSLGPLFVLILEQNVELYRVSFTNVISGTDVLYCCRIQRVMLSFFLFSCVLTWPCDLCQSQLLNKDLELLQTELMEASLSDTMGLNFFEDFHISPIKVGTWDVNQWGLVIVINEWTSLPHSCISACRWAPAMRIWARKQQPFSLWTFCWKVLEQHWQMLMISFLSESLYPLCVLLEQRIVGISDQAPNVNPFKEKILFQVIFETRW